MLRCIVCRTRRASFASMQRHAAATHHTAACTCGGYHYPHRPGSGCCERNVWAELRQAERDSASEEELLDAFIGCTLRDGHKPSTQKEAPF